MKNIVTLSDYNYLYKGLALYESLASTSSEKFNLYYLCLDDDSYNKLKSLNLPNLTPIHTNVEGLSRDPNVSYSTNNPSGKKFRHYCFSLSSRGVKYLFKKYKLKDIFYIDSDIFFYEDIDLLKKESEDKAVAIFPHLHVPKPTYVGAYNVGVIYFKNNPEGNEVLNFWEDCVVNSKNKYRNSGYDTCGDQKYVELFEDLFPKSIHIYGSKNIVHGAPYNYEYFVFLNFLKKVVKFTRPPGYQNIEYIDKEYIMPFFHFMGFFPDFENNSYAPSNEPNNQRFMLDPLIRLAYNDYFLFCKNISDRYGLSSNNSKIKEVKYA